MCICLNCYYINLCSQYHLVETNHAESHISKKPEFFPVQSIFNVKIKTNRSQIEIEWDVIECLSFREKPAHWVDFIN